MKIFGNQSNQQVSVSYNGIVAGRFYLPERAEISAFNGFMGTFSNDLKIKFFLYADNNGQAGDLIVASPELHRNQPGGSLADIWNRIAVTPFRVNLGFYWLAMAGYNENISFNYGWSDGQGQYSPIPVDEHNNNCVDFVRNHFPQASYSERVPSIFAEYTSVKDIITPIPIIQ